MNNKLFLLPQPGRILVIAMRYLGDVLLTTSLLRSLRQAYPDSQIEMLVFHNTVTMLEGNPDISNIITIPNRPKFAEIWQLIRQLFRRYDLAVVTQTGDRPFLYSLLAAPMRLAIVPPKNTTGWWKRFFVRYWIEHDDNLHVVLQNLKLLDFINVPRCYSLVAPQISNQDEFTFLAKNLSYAVLHPYPQWTYKQWTIEGWVEVGHYLHNQGLTLVLSGGPSLEEMEYVATIQQQLPDDTINLAGQVSLAELATIIAQAKLYIGPDTGITHMAAATGIPVIALYGPTNPEKWAPWPCRFAQNSNPFDRTGSKVVNNISLIQGQKGCVPCQLEGCDRHRQSRSACLDGLAFERVKQAIDGALSLS